jgi:predicted RNA-binding protein with RPS1 domain
MQVTDVISNLPTSTSTFPSVGSTVTVQVEEFNAEGKKLVLSMKFENRAEVGSLSEVSSQKWLQGVVTSVSSFGLFVRPAGHEGVGLVHQSRVPRDLIGALKKLAPIPAGTNKTDIENLFQEGDVVKVRTQSVAVGSRRIELSMLPYKASDDEEDDYVVEGRDPEGEEDKFQDRDNDDQEDASYDAEDTLLWWRGAPYVKTGYTAEAEKLDEEFEVLNESKDVVEGSWRRMFEVDMREDEADFSSKALEAEIKELEEEIGELNGLDEELVDAVGFGQSLQPTKIGSFVSMSAIPSGWKEEMEFFKDLDTINTKKTTGLRAGKASEQAEFEALLKEVEIELEQAAARAPKAPVEPELKVVEPADEEVDAPASA